MACRLPARLWLPEDASEHPVPAVLENIPYCKDDATAARDAAMHPTSPGTVTQPSGSTCGAAAPPMAFSAMSTSRSSSRTARKYCGG
jgi:predicted acyl esterase